MEKEGLKAPYDAPMLKIILTEHFDIITSSGGSLGEDGNGSPSYDSGGWT